MNDGERISDETIQQDEGLRLNSKNEDKSPDKELKITFHNEDFGKSRDTKRYTNSAEDIRHTIDERN